MTQSRGRSRARERAAIAVAVIGALATIATSAPPTFQLEASAEATIEPGTPTHVVIRLSRPALAHSSWLTVMAGPTTTREGLVTITPDDASIAPAEQSMILGVAAELCPGEEACDVGLELLLEGESAADVLVQATLSRDADGRFLFPEDRSFTEASTIEVLFE